MCFCEVIGQQLSIFSQRLIITKRRIKLGTKHRCLPLVLISKFQHLSLDCGRFQISDFRKFAILHFLLQACKLSSYRFGVKRNLVVLFLAITSRLPWGLFWPQSLVWTSVQTDNIAFVVKPW